MEWNKEINLRYENRIWSGDRISEENPNWNKTHNEKLRKSNIKLSGKPRQQTGSGGRETPGLEDKVEELDYSHSENIQSPKPRHKTYRNPGHYKISKPINHSHIRRKKPNQNYLLQYFQQNHRSELVKSKEWDSY